MSTALLQSPLAQWLSSQRLPGVQLYIGRMEQGGQLQAAGRHAHPAARDRAITPEYYRGTDTLNGPVHRTKDSGRRSASFASPQGTTASQREQQTRPAYPTSPFQQAIDNTQEAEPQPEPTWYQNAVPPMDASEAANTALAAITNAANTVGNTLAWWGTYITDIVAEVTGDSNEPSEEDVQKQEQQRLADKEASKHNHESVSGDIAPQPLTRRHSRTGSAGSLPRGASGNLSQGPSGSLMRNQSGGLVRGASTFLEENWQVVPKSPGPNIPKSPAPNGHDNAPAAADPDGEDEFVKKDT